jgi:hypothetical protein
MCARRGFLPCVSAARIRACPRLHPGRRAAGADCWSPCPKRALCRRCHDLLAKLLAAGPAPAGAPPGVSQDWAALAHFRRAALLQPHAGCRPNGSSSTLAAPSSPPPPPALTSPPSCSLAAQSRAGVLARLRQRGRRAGLRRGPGPRRGGPLAQAGPEPRSPPRRSREQWLQGTLGFRVEADGRLRGRGRQGSAQWQAAVVREAEALQGGTCMRPAPAGGGRGG